MDTPICDFVGAYAEKNGPRLHMPGHKGRAVIGPESLDITEIKGADELYHARGIIRKSEENAAALFGAGKTVYSAEGSSLCVRAMVYLALLRGRAAGRKPLILAGRNAHRSFIGAAALLDAEIRWVFPEKDQSLLSCDLSAARLERLLAEMDRLPSAVYVTSPDYLGHITDIGALAGVCRKYQTPLLVDNAHGAYLKFLPEDRHPMTLGADMCCDSAHKTLPVLTGGAYLHIAKAAPPLFGEQAERAMALFASSSPSYLILQSLDKCNAYLAGDYPENLAALAARAAHMKARLREHGYALVGEEAVKLTVAPKAYGYTGDALHDLLRGKNMECEFSDPDFVTAMLTPALDQWEIDRLEAALLRVPPKAPLNAPPPPPPRPERVMTVRQAMLAPSVSMPVEKALGRVLADAHVGCPPCVPILICGERIDGDAAACFRYYGVESCRVVAE